MNIIDASLGFTAPVWQVALPDGEVKYVRACDNYTACEAAGSRFAVCDVRELPSPQA